jgi:hypothetical protein
MHVLYTATSLLCPCLLKRLCWLLQLVLLLPLTLITMILLLLNVGDAVPAGGSWARGRWPPHLGRGLHS